jgi:hypothetical protein
VALGEFSLKIVPHIGLPLYVAKAPASSWVVYAAARITQNG